jgi:hypothetical protein
MALISSYSIRFDQRNGANTAYTESFVSGSNLILTTNSTGIVTGSYIVPSSSLSITASYTETASYANQIFVAKQSFSSSTTWSFYHNLNTTSPFIQIYNQNNDQMIPAKIQAINNSTSSIQFSFSASGIAIAR